MSLGSAAAPTSGTRSSSANHGPVSILSVVRFVTISAPVMRRRDSSASCTTEAPSPRSGPVRRAASSRNVAASVRSVSRSARSWVTSSRSWLATSRSRAAWPWGPRALQRAARPGAQGVHPPAGSRGHDEPHQADHDFPALGHDSVSFSSAHCTPPGGPDALPNGGDHQDARKSREERRCVQPSG